MVPPPAALDRARDLAAREDGLAVAVTLRPDGLPRASVVNAGVVAHPRTGEDVVAFVSPGAVRKLDDLRARPAITVVFRSGRDWVAIEGTAELVAPDGADALALVRTVYAAAAGGTPEQWAPLDERFVAEGHTVVLVHPRRAYPPTDDEPRSGVQ